MAKRSFTRLWLVLLATIVITGCTKMAQGAEIRSDKPRAISDATSQETLELVAGNTAFASDLYQLLRQKSDGNLFFSPHSISLALAMTYAGARGETEQQMAVAMRYGLPQARLHPAINALDATLSEQDDAESFELHIANAIWGQQGYQFLPAFLDTLAENYGAGIREVDFVSATEAARKTINDWISDQTKDRIRDLIPQGALDNLTRLVLTNAIYFNGKWALPFDRIDTYDGPFTLPDGSTVTVPLMTQTAGFRYAAGDNYQAIQLPYRDSSMSMLLILPEIDDFATVEAGFSPALLDEIAGNLAREQVHLVLPKYTFQSEINLSQALMELGMPVAFSESADFSGMTGNRELSISEVLHKAFVKVDEEGTEAAAATGVVMRLTSLNPSVIQMRLDHPFLFMIQDNHSGTVLFLGRVLNPAP
jgi:serpin B